MMEASARDSEDEAEDASAKRANTSPLGLRVGAVAAVEMSKSKGKDIPPVVQTKLDEQGGSSRFNTSKEDWLTPKKMEATVSTGPVTAQQSAGTFQNTSSYASPVNKTMDKMETDESTPINVSVRRHSSLATYSRKTLQRSSETSTLGNESSCQNGSLKIDDRALRASTAFNISASKPGSSVERTTLFEDLDKLHDKESTPLLAQAKLTDGPVSNKGSEKIHHSREATLFEDLDKLHGEESTPLLPQAKLTDGSVSDKGSEKIHHSSEASIPPPAMSTAENIISKYAPERSSPEPMVRNILLQEPRSGSPKQNLSVVPSINDNTEGKEVAHKLDLSDSATRLFSSSGVLKEADKWTAEAISLKGALDEVPERSVTAEPVMMRSSNSPGSGLTGMKDQVETEQPKRKTAPRKSLGTRGRKKNPINLKGSIYLSEPTPKDEHTDDLIKGIESALATDNNSNQKEKSSPVLNAEAVPEMAKRNDSETDAVERIDSDKPQAKSPEEANAEVEITVLEPERTDDPSDGALQLEVKKSKTKRTSEASVGKNSLQSGKKGSSSTAEVGNSGVKKTKKSRKGDDGKANDTVMEDMGDKSTNEMENFALENKFGKVSSDGDQSPAAGETLVSTEAETPNDAAVQPGVDKNNGKRIGEATGGKTRLQSGKKRGSSAVGKASIKKAKKSKKDDETEANDDTVMNDIEIESAEARENAAVDKKPEDVPSDGTQSPVARKPLARKETAAAKKSSNAAMQLEVPKNKRKNKKESTVESSSLQSGEKENSSTAEVGTSSVKKPKKSKKESVTKASDTVMKDVEDNSAEEENTAVDDNKSGRDKNPRKKAAKSAKTGAKVVKESKQLSSSKKALQEQIKQEPKHFIVSGPKVQRKEYQKIIRLLKGKCCRDSHQWSYQATHFIVPEIRRTEKFFAAAASGRYKQCPS